MSRQPDAVAYLYKFGGDVKKAKRRCRVENNEEGEIKITDSHFDSVQFSTTQAKELIPNLEALIERLES